MLIASVDRNRVIGRDGDLAWRHPDDLLRVRRLTMGGTLVMGRRTYDSIGRPLAGRRTIVVTRRTDWQPAGVTVVHSVGGALEAAGGDVIGFGGGEIYAQLLPHADRLEMTEIDAELAGDVYFPEIDPARWSASRREERDGFSWVTYERRQTPTRGRESRRDQRRASTVAPARAASTMNASAKIT
ncbi:dihydrofolate reductase [Paractinoplanes rishiriensis]|uniref:Dihydrofolate reductase n=2 Tax=Paractinoplanes rishiriensis TaxID=1050105 RepID=A0A919K1I5_9ACTN|nr:dihydrofolate reductase [Actinoplanes rishiriensis]